MDDGVARALLVEQLPEYADLRLRRVASGGTDNAVFRLGDELALRLPLRLSAVSGLLKEIRWLPSLAPHLTLEVPEFVDAGRPTSTFELPWAVLRWLPGEDALTAGLDCAQDAADSLARFVRELQAVPTTGAPAPGAAGFVRGMPLAHWDDAVREALTRCGGLLDAARVAAVWDDAVAAAAYEGPPVWLHADLIPGNVLLRDGRITGILDFGALAIGDPAYDVTPAWHLLDASGRDNFRDLIGVDDATWRRARGIVVALAAFALPYYRDSNPAMMRTARRGVEQVLSDLPD